MPDLFTAFTLLLSYVKSQDIARLEPTASIPRIFSQYEIEAFYSSEPALSHVGLFAKIPDLAIGIYHYRAPEGFYSVQSADFDLRIWVLSIVCCCRAEGSI